ncbi:uncharacterized protein [Taeniopygia guttata]|uniref:uncharacterized protein isoform X6 n=1 Tax=Taeniopygia guttata TaxID=59729 RepID=UPI003BB8C4FD
MSRDPRYYEPDPIKAPRAADSAAPPPAPAPPGAAGPAGDTDPPTADAPPAFPLQPSSTPPRKGVVREALLALLS